MPNFAIALTVLIIAAIFFAPTTNDPRPADEDVIVSAGVGGLVRPGAGDATSDTADFQFSVSEGTNVSIANPAPEPEVEPVQLPPIITTFSAQNIETTRALLRASVTYIGEPYRSTIYFRVSDDPMTVAEQSLSAAESASVYETGMVSERISGLEPDTTYYYQACSEGGFICGDIVSFVTEPDWDSAENYRKPSATIQRPREIQAESATLTGQYRMRDSTVNTSFFVYGLNSDAVRNIDRNYDEYSEVREQGDALQKVRAGVNLTGTGERTRTIDDLQREETYYARYCVAYDDDEQGIVCSSTTSFDTKARDREKPSFSLTDALLSQTQVEFVSRVSMGDHFDGQVFLVYGTNEERIEAVSEYSSVDRINQYEDELQRRTLAVDFDGESQVTYTEVNVLPVQYYYRVCVEYEAEDYRGYLDATITCDVTRTVDTR
jgi:hypothetical protein